MSKDWVAIASIVTLTGTLIATGVHHVFRLGSGLVIPILIGIVVSAALYAFYGRTRRPAILWSYVAYAGLVVFWFGFLDGFLDHVAKAAGFDNITFLEGSEAEIVATSMHLWSQAATTAFYEGTGMLSAVLALLTTISTAMFAYREMGVRPARGSS